ncbi:MAG: DUF3141 domain-containing protein [Syntrophaceae bacterium]|jgi:pimeloyl-ACP methyl ester carboxylesterase|nr:DUF3141 domain-containing protein [Syntrophaceae bacterium]
MNLPSAREQTRQWFDWQKHYLEYLVDSIQRSVIFTDILRKRGNNYIRHIRSGQPPVLTFNYEMILNAKHFKHPVNYALVRISDRRRKMDPVPENVNRRQSSRERPSRPKRPIVIIDPRAGHGPGIGGSKRDSEIGMALDHGHPVYFVLFYTEPFPDQTMPDVITAIEKFMEKVVELHPYADAPAIIGNCQAGWAAALACAERPDVTGPLVLNGAPLSYWSGVAGVNPMRYKGGLVGGVWINSFLSDMGNGIFDGANLVLNFELLNPANTFWSKQYHVYEKVDSEEERYLNFERWWGGFFLLNDDEIHYIVRNLFVGNKLESGQLELREGEKVSLKNIDNPIIVFASQGDNITPAQQALNWIPRVYSSVEDIRRHRQVIVYIIHKDIGHLGIFVAGSVAKKEHKNIIGNFDMIEFLQPGLYELVIDGDIRTEKFTARFVPRTFSDIAAYDDDVRDEDDFRVVAKVSEVNDNLYKLWIRPWIKLWVTELQAEINRYAHPLRFQRFWFADINPLMRPVKNIAEIARNHRQPAALDNPFMEMEHNLSDYMEGLLNVLREYRDRSEEILFQQIYGNVWLKRLFPPSLEKSAPETTESDQDHDDGKHLVSMEEGGVAAGLIRIYMATAKVVPHFKREHFDVGEKIAKTHKILQKLRPSQFKKIMHDQMAILDADEENAIRTLSVLIKDKDERLEALNIARRLCLADGIYSSAEKKMVEKIKKGLDL